MNLITLIMAENYRKYRNKKTIIDGITFDSRKEAVHYTYLQNLVKLGEITDLKLQQKFLIVPKENKNTRARYYVADFTYINKNGEKIIEDVKSPITKKNPVYSLKKALILYLYPEYTFIES